MSERIRELVLKGAENCTPEEAREVLSAEVVSERIRELVLKGAENCTPEEAREVLSAVERAINAPLPPPVAKIDTSLPYCDCMKKLIGGKVVIKSGIDGFYYDARFDPVTGRLNSRQITSGHCPMCEAIIPAAPHYHDRKHGEK